MRASAVLLSVAALCAAVGCVERTLLIRSEPAGAPVWVDEQYVGETPFEYPFAHYGVRRLRVGPLRDENDKLAFEEVEREALVEAPWYETFPLDFFAEVLYPGTLRDEHLLPVFELPPAAAERHGEERVQEVREQAGQFRERALRTIPEASPAP